MPYSVINVGRKIRIKELKMLKRARSRALSRRTIVTRGVACAAGAAALLAPLRQAAAKMAQKGAEYQDTPKGDQQCSNCSLFQEPNACTLVDGEISPAGWCKFWVKKTG
jgi:high potential iron-sulfur protein